MPAKLILSRRSIRVPPTKCNPSFHFSMSNIYQFLCLSIAYIFQCKTEKPTETKVSLHLSIQKFSLAANFRGKQIRMPAILIVILGSIRIPPTKFNPLFSFSISYIFQFLIFINCLYFSMPN